VSIIRRLLGDAVVYSLTPLLSSLVGFVLVPIYTRTFTPSDYGALALVNTTTALASIFVVFGLDNSSAVWFWEHPEPAERHRTFSSWLAFTTVFSFLLAGVAILLRHPLSHWILREDKLSRLWVLFAVNLVALNVPRIGILWFRMKRSPWPAVLLAGLTSIGTGVCGVFFVVHLKLGLAGVIAGQAAGAWVGSIVTLLALRGVFSVRAIDVSRLAPMLRLSAPLVLMTNLSWMMGGAVSYFVSFICSREDAGLYQVANSLASVLGLLMFAFDQAWAPLALSIRDVPVARRVYGVTVEAAFVLGLLLAFTATVFAKPALMVITHPQYVRGQWVLALLSLNTALINIPSVLSVTFAREKVTMPLAKATAAGAAVTVILLPLLAKTLGKEGAALAVVVGTITIVTLSFRASQRVFPIEVHVRRAGVAIVLTTAAVTIFLLLRTFVSSLGGMIGQGIVLVLCLAAALSVVYRAPLKAAWLEARPARGSA